MSKFPDFTNIGISDSMQHVRIVSELHAHKTFKGNFSLHLVLLGGLNTQYLVLMLYRQLQEKGLDFCFVFLTFLFHFSTIMGAAIVKTFPRVCAIFLDPYITEFI
jgi:hypothetical protein